MDAARLEQVVVSFPPAGRGLTGLDLRVPAARVTALLGPNGAGKSTAVGVLAGLIRPRSGTAAVLGGMPGRREARCRVGVMVQDDGLPSGAHAVELVRHVARLRDAPETAERWVDALGLPQLGRTTIRRLSGGERRRVSLACALVGHPELVILDEPTSGLDPRGRAIVWEAVTGLRAQGCAVLICTHLLDEAEALADSIAIIAHGRLRAQGSLEELIGEGGETVSFDGPMHLDLAGLLRALPEDCTAREVTPGRYRIAGAVSAHTLTTVAAWCAQHGLQPRNLSLGADRLADVFWQLTDEGRERP